MKYVHAFILSLVTVGALTFPAMVNAASLDPIDSSGVQIQRQEQNGIAYLSGGIGEDEAKAIQQTTGYNLRMTFSIGAEGKYIPDVDLIIQNAQGPVLTLSQAGPLVYVQLPPGKYTVVATRNGETKRDTADVASAGAKNLVFNWNTSE